MVTVCSGAELCVGLGFGVVVVGFGVGVVLPPSLGLGEALELSLALELLLALVVLGGLVALLAGLLDWLAVLVLVAAFDGLDEAVGDDEHGAKAVAEPLPSAGALGAVALPSSPPGPALADGDAWLCELSPAVTRIWWRSGGTAASTTPTANTAMPTASAGRSIASRQSPDHCGACRAWDGPEPCPLRSDGAVRLVHSWCQRLSSPARNPEIAALRDWAAVA
jgi:hypothetical protein